MAPANPRQHLLDQLRLAQGRDATLDQAIACDLDVPTPAPPVPDYTASVDRCLELLHRLLPEWHWHVGYGANGVLPYARVSDAVHHFEADAPTVPLALLMVIVQARLALEADTTAPS